MKTINVTRDIKFVNVGEDPPRPKPGKRRVGTRQWNACAEYGFISAGQGKKYNRPLLNLKLNDIIAGYITGHGYVGLGVVAEEAVRIKDFLYNGKSLSGLPYIKESLFENADNEKSEFVVRIKWLKTVDKKDAYWEKNAGLFAYRGIESTLKEQPKTILFLEKCFDVKFNK
jgi:hypothetical protein